MRASRKDGLAAARPVFCEVVELDWTERNGLVVPSNSDKLAPRLHCKGHATVATGGIYSGLLHAGGHRGLFGPLGGWEALAGWQQATGKLVFLLAAALYCPTVHTLSPATPSNCDTTTPLVVDGCINVISSLGSTANLDALNLPESLHRHFSTLPLPGNSKPPFLTSHGPTIED